jgi:flavin reductase (DIM6/NTAB) family NADH-FMN oxidoreductase RutF
VRGTIRPRARLDQQDRLGVTGTLEPLVPVDRDTFVEIMASYPAGVAIVTTLDADGTPRG